MTLQDILNVTGLSIGMIGSYLMFHFSTKVDSGTYIYMDEEFQQLKKKDAFINKMIRLGMLLIGISFLIQLAVLLIR